MNHVSLIGRLTRDPELKFTGGGEPVCEFRLAVDRAGDKDKESGEIGAGYFDVTFWGRTAEIAGEYLTKGRQVGVSGALKFHEWESQDGTKRSKVEIRGFELTFVGSRGDGEGGDEERQGSFEAAQPVAAAPAVDDDIPF